MTTKQTTKPATPCVHRWLCEPPNGPTSRATCRLCGAEREFRNASVADYGGDWAAWNGVTCAHCGRAFGSRGAMVSHVRAAHQMPFEVPA